MASEEEYFKNLCLLTASRSPDPNTKVGACIVDEFENVIGLGFNCMPKNTKDLPWDREGNSPLDTKYPYVCHAELNAVANSANRNLRGCKIYVTLFPCNECTKVLLQNEIKAVIYLEDKYPDTDQVKASKRMLDSAQIPYRTFQ